MHVNKINDKKYIGITKRDPGKRWENGRGYSKNVHFYRAIKKYGWDNFDHIILYEGLTKDKACQTEKDLIKKYKTTEKEYGYNNCAGGEGVSGYHHTETTKKIISERMKGEHNPNYGGVHNTPEQMKKLLEANLGSKQTEEHKKKIREALRGQHYHDETFKKALSERASHPVQRDDGVIYKSVKEAAEVMGVCRAAISQSIKRNQKSCGYVWSYVKA